MQNTARHVLDRVARTPAPRAHARTRPGRPAAASWARPGTSRASRDRASPTRTHPTRTWAATPPRARHIGHRQSAPVSQQRTASTRRAPQPARCSAGCGCRRHRTHMSPPRVSARAWLRPPAIFTMPSPAVHACRHSLANGNNYNSCRISNNRGSVQSACNHNNTDCPLAAALRRAAPTDPSGAAQFWAP